MITLTDLRNQPIRGRKADNTEMIQINSIFKSYRRRTAQYTRFIHCSGLAMVEVREEGELVWSDNLAAKTGSNRKFGGGGMESSGYLKDKRSMREELDELRKSLIGLCGDEKRLRRFWEECWERLKVEAASELNGGGGGTEAVGL